MDDMHNDEHQRKTKRVRGEGPHTELRVLLASKVWATIKLIPTYRTLLLC